MYILNLMIAGIMFMPKNDLKGFYVALQFKGAFKDYLYRISTVYTYDYYFFKPDNPLNYLHCSLENWKTFTIEAMHS